MRRLVGSLDPSLPRKKTFGKHNGIDSPQESIGAFTGVNQELLNPHHEETATVTP